MNLVLSDETGREYRQTDDFTLKHQYGDTCNFELELPFDVEPHHRFHIDGTPYAGVLDKPCPSHTSKGDSISYKGRTIQQVFGRRVVMPPAGKSHLSFKGEANQMLAMAIGTLGLSGYLRADAEDSGIYLDYTFYRFVDWYSGIRMALASQGARLDIVCQQGGHLVRAVPSRTYGSLDSEKVYFSMDCDTLPVNKLVGLGKGEGTARAISVWYADLLGNVSQTQSLFGLNVNELAYPLNGEGAVTLPAKTKKKLLEYQEGSNAKVSVPDDVSLDVGDVCAISSAKYRLNATTQVKEVVFTYKDGKPDVSYEFGVPDYPEEEG